MPRNIVFMATPDFALPLMRALMASPHTVKAVFTRSPKPAGRGREQRRSAVHDCAAASGIEVFFPERLAKDDPEPLRRLAPDLVVTAAYGRILPQSWLDVPKMGCINAHASLLPRWRGAAPIQRAIMAGDRQSGISIIAMNAQCDAGDILAQEKVPLHGRDTFADLHDRLARVASGLTLRVIDDMENGSARPLPQNHHQATVAPRIDRDECRLDWHLSAAIIRRHIHGLSPTPGAWCFAGGDGGQANLEGAHLERTHLERLGDGERAHLGGAHLERTHLERTGDGERAHLGGAHLGGGAFRLKILRADIIDQPSTSPPGTILDDRFSIACGDGVLRPSHVQKSGKAPMAIDDFLRGTRLAIGDRLA